MYYTELSFIKQFHNMYIITLTSNSGSDVADIYVTFIHCSERKGMLVKHKCSKLQQSPKQPFVVEKSQSRSL